MWIKDFCVVRDTESKLFLNSKVLPTEEHLLSHFTGERDPSEEVVDI